MSHIQAGAQDDLTARNKTLQTDKDHEEMWVRWIKQRIHGELDSLRMALDLPEEFDIFASIAEGEQKHLSAEVELEAQRIQASLNEEGGREPAEEELARMRQEAWYEHSDFIHAGDDDDM